MPTWRERGAHPRSVTFLVAASSAPSTAASALSCPYSSGLTPVPTPMTALGTGQCLEVVVAALGEHPDPSPGADGSGLDGPGLDGPGLDWDVALDERRRRQHPRPHGDHLRGATARDVGHQRSREGRLGRHQLAVTRRERDRVAHQP